MKAKTGSYEKRGDSYRFTVKYKGLVATATLQTIAAGNAWAIEAKAELKKKHSNLQSAGIPAPAEAHSFLRDFSGGLHDFFDIYLAQVTAIEKWKGYKWEASRIEKFKREIPDQAISKLTLEALEKWRDKKKVPQGKYKKPLAPNSIIREMTVMSGILTRAWKWKVIATNPMAGIDWPEKGEERTQRYTDEQRDKIVKELGWEDGTAPKGGRQEVAILFLLALETGGRLSEPMKLNLKDVNFNDRTALFRETKDRDSNKVRNRPVPLSSRAVELIKLLAQANGDKLFSIKTSTAGQYFTTAKATVGMAKFQFRDARRTALTKLAKKFPNVMDLAKISGHRDLKILLNTYYQADAAELAKALD